MTSCNKPPAVEANFPLKVVLLVAATVWVFWPALHGDWLWDDDLDITANAITRSPGGLWSIWFVPGSQFDYYPIKASVQWVQWHLWGADTLGYHLTNVILHLAGALLVWGLLRKFGLKFAWLGGMLFAVHPANVESVAWIAELKNVLSLPPLLVAMIAWIDYGERGRRRDYLLALLFFFLALLCKTSVVMFPFVILLYAWWKQGKIGPADLKSSTPFFVISLGLGLLTVWLQLHPLIHEPSVEMGGLASRIACAGLSIAFYFSHFIWPLGLSPNYPKWAIDPPSPGQFLPWVILTGGIYACWRERTGWGRHGLLGLGFFLINLAPFLGLFGAFYMRLSWVMDHFLYLPMIGLIGLTMAGLSWLEQTLPRSGRPYGTGVIMVIMAGLAWESHGYAGKFVDQETLCLYTLERNPGSWVARNYLGLVYLHSNRIPLAMEQFDLAARANPKEAAASENNLGTALIVMGRFPEAMEKIQAALQLQPDSAEAHYNLAIVLGRLGRTSAEMAQYEEALRLNPRYAEAHNNLGALLLQAGHQPEALEEFQTALQLNPQLAEAHYNLGNYWYITGEITEAAEQYQQALRINPLLAEAHWKMGDLLMQVGRKREAIDQYQQGLELKPGDAEAHYKLGNALLWSENLLSAMDEFREALRIDPSMARAHNNLGIALVQSNRFPEAKSEFEAALKIDPHYADAQKNMARLQELRKNKPGPAK
jgi:tetratricopeptide (TPR) repeat protein